MFCGNAGGRFVPPMVLYRAKNVETEWMTAGRVGAMYDATPSGWFEEVFLLATNDLVGPHVIIGDNLASHFEPAVFWRNASSSRHSCQTRHTCCSHYTYWCSGPQSFTGARYCISGRPKLDRVPLSRRRTFLASSTDCATG